MFKSILLMCSFVIAISVVACSKSESGTNRSTAAPASSPAASPAASAHTPVASSGEKVGVPECDQFLASYESCISGKVPEAQRAQFNAGLTQWRSSWKKLAETPQGKATLPGICKTQLDTAKTTMKAFACTW
jgi:hypothetical protein